MASVGHEQATPSASKSVDDVTARLANKIFWQKGESAGLQRKKPGDLPWESWELDDQFFKALSRWTLDHPETSLDHILDNIQDRLESSQDAFQLVPDSPFPARSLVLALTYLLKLGVTVHRAQKHVQQFAKDVIRWVGIMKYAFGSTETGRFTHQAWRDLKHMRELIDKICLWAAERIDDRSWSLIGHGLLIQKEIKEFNEQITNARALFQDLSAISVARGLDALMENMHNLIRQQQTVINEIQKIQPNSLSPPADSKPSGKLGHTTNVTCETPEVKTPPRAPANGQRDGQFVVFKNWDIPKHDIAYYPQFSRQVNKLKSVALSNPNALITAFNTKGWIKSCSVHDFSKWRPSRGCDMYVRVEYPGWHFIQGMDSGGDDINVTPLENNIAGIMVDILVRFQEKQSARVAGFNTNGWIKSRVHSNLQHFSDFALDGLYVRTEFQGYDFYQGVDSPGGDIIWRRDLVNNTVALADASNSQQNALGFNTNGWVKESMTVPPIYKRSRFDAPTKGTYVRSEWPGFVYLPMLDSPRHDVKWLSGKHVWELVDAARSDSKIVAFNSNGWMKTKLADTLVEEDNPLFGLYVKVPSLPTSANAGAFTYDDINVFLTIMKATAIVWGKGLLSGSTIRAKFAKAVAFGAQNILDRLKTGSLSSIDAAQEALSIQTTLLHSTHTTTSPFGRVLAQAIKPRGLPYQTLLDDYAQSRYQKSFKRLTPEQSYKVVGDAINASGRVGSEVTIIMTKVGYVPRVLIAIGAAVSIYRVVTADEWKFEICKQVGKWSTTITEGKFSTGVGCIVGPIGAVVCGIAGGLLGSVASRDEGTKSSRWFFGGKSSLSAGEILGSTLYAATLSLVRAQLKQSGQKFHVHQVHATHVSSQVDTNTIAKDMVGTKSEERVDVEVIATIVWVATPKEILAANAANPADLVTLMTWARRNLPS